MKLITVIRDGSGALHLAATGAPDLLRRQISAQTGSADLAWCGVPPAGMTAKGVISDDWQGCPSVSCAALGGLVGYLRTIKGNLMPGLVPARGLDGPSACARKGQRPGG